MRFLILGLDTPIINSNKDKTEENKVMIKEPEDNEYKKYCDKKIDINSSSSHFYLERNSLFDEEATKKDKNQKSHGLVV